MTESCVPYQVFFKRPREYFIPALRALRDADSRRRIGMCIQTLASVETPVSAAAKGVIAAENFFGRE